MNKLLILLILYWVSLPLIAFLDFRLINQTTYENYLWFSFIEVGIFSIGVWLGYTVCKKEVKNNVSKLSEM